MKKKNKFLNLIMVLAIVLIAAAGILVAMWLVDTADSGDIMGSEFSVKAIPDNKLISSENPENICTMTIVCTTILDNLENLDEAKLPYVPKDGVILPKTEIEFAPGETAFDVLQRTCEAGEIQLEFSWSPIYDSSYIEGINHLYEFDCGFESGWMYKVNNSFPNYGCSAYELKNGNDIVWCYTCVGLGTDVGGSNWQDQ